MSDLGDMGGLGGLLGGFQQKMQALQDEADALRVRREVGGGAVAVTATGNQEIVSVEIDDAAMDDRELLEDLVRAAANEALDAAKAETAAKMQALTAGLPLPPGLLG